MVLVTGALGNTGPYVIKKLLTNGIDVLALDQPSRFSRKKIKHLNKIAKNNQRTLVFYYQNLASDNLEQLFKTYQLSGIIHLSFIIPPFSEINPDYARKVNVDATRKLIQLAENYAKTAPFVFSSSTTVYGPADSNESVITIDHPTKATSHYTGHKLECEAMLKQSTLDWRILRLSAIMNPIVKAGPESVKFAMQLDLKMHIEPVHIEDVVTAIYHALTLQAASHKIFIISGGKDSQMTYQDYVFKTIQATVKNLRFEDIPWHKFAHKAYYLNWYDTTESQSILAYQQHSFEDFATSITKNIPWWKKLLINTQVGKRIAINHILTQSKVSTQKSN